MMIDLKNFHCTCGVYSTPPKELNSITHEHLQFCIDNGYEYREAIIKLEDNTTILLCPNCNKELYRRYQ